MLYETNDLSKHFWDIKQLSDINTSDVSDIIMFSSPPHPALRLGPGLPPTPFQDPSFLTSHAAQQRHLAGKQNFYSDKYSCTKLFKYL